MTNTDFTEFLSTSTPVGNLQGGVMNTIIRGKKLAILLLSSCLSASSILAFSSPAQAAELCAKDKVYLVQSGRGLENPYYAFVNKGAEAFAKSVNLKSNWISSEGDSQKQLSQITSIVNEHKNCAVINVDPNESAILPAILDVAKAKGAHVIVQWNRPKGVTPKVYGDTFVAFMSENGYNQGYGSAIALLKAMGGKGSIVALQGILDNVPAQTRYAGLQAALKEYPKVKLLEQQTANWDQNEAQKLTQTFLTKYGKKITGVWTANDSMGLGALAALKAKKRTEVPVVGTDGLTQVLKLIEKGNGKSGFIATSVPGGAVQGAIGLAIGYQAAIGTHNVATAKAEYRAFYLKTNIATKANIKATLALAEDPVPALNFKDIWSVVGDVVPENL